jgi:hypothetical protein
MDVLSRAPEECRLEHTVGDLGLSLQVEKGEVDVARRVRAEPWRKTRGAGFNLLVGDFRARDECHTKLPLLVDGTEGRQ